MRRRRREGTTFSLNGLKKQKVTEASQEIPHPTTGSAQPDLTDEIERDRVYCRRYEPSMPEMGVAHLYIPVLFTTGAVSVYLVPQPFRGAKESAADNPA